MNIRANDRARDHEYYCKRNLSSRVVACKDCEKKTYRESDDCTAGNPAIGSSDQPGKHSHKQATGCADQENEKRHLDHFNGAGNRL